MSDSNVDLDNEFYYSQWNTKDCAILTSITSTYEDYKEILIKTIDNLTIYQDKEGVAWKE